MLFAKCAGEHSPRKRGIACTSAIIDCCATSSTSTTDMQWAGTKRVIDFAAISKSGPVGVGPTSPAP